MSEVDSAASDRDNPIPTNELHCSPAVRSHLDACRDCRAYAVSLTALDKQLKAWKLNAWPAAEFSGACGFSGACEFSGALPSGGFAERVLSSISAREPLVIRLQRWLRSVRLAPLGAAAAGLAAGIWLSVAPASRPSATAPAVAVASEQSVEEVESVFGASFHPLNHGAVEGRLLAVLTVSESAR